MQTCTDARRRLSEDLHASAETLNPATVTHASLVVEIAKSDEWLESVFKRQKEAEPQLRHLPPELTLRERGYSQA